MFGNVHDRQIKKKILNFTNNVFRRVRFVAKESMLTHNPMLLIHILILVINQFYLTYQLIKNMNV